MLVDRMLSMNNPSQLIAVGSSGGALSLWAMLEQGTTILGFVGALFGCLTAVGGFIIFCVKVKRDMRAKKQLRRRHDDD